jgi:site-specific recombinase XerD
VVAIEQAEQSPIKAGVDRTVSEEVRRRLAEAVPANTRRAYTWQWRRFSAWCERTGRCALPATRETLLEYTAFLIDQDMAPSTVGQAVFALRSVHRDTRVEPPDGHEAQVLLRAYRRKRVRAGIRARQAPPIGVTELRALIAVTEPDGPMGARDRVLLTLGFAMMSRRSELVALELPDVREVEQGLVVLVRMSKDDQEARGREVPVPYARDPTLCPVRTFQAWRDLLAAQGVTTGPLLRRVDRWGHCGEALSGGGVRWIVRTLAERADLPGDLSFSPHSLRAGGATAAARAGAPVSSIAGQGGWSPRSPVVHDYVRQADRWRDHPLRGVL